MATAAEEWSSVHNSSSMSIGKAAEDRGYSVSKAELLDWASRVLGLPMSRLELCASGAAYCQLFDAYTPGKLNLPKVNFAAELEYEFVTNYKQLQIAFNKSGVDKYIEVERLVKAVPADNLEFLQWLYGHCRRIGSPASGYSAPERRAGCKGGTLTQLPLPQSVTAKHFAPVTEANSPFKKVQDSGLLEPNVPPKGLDSRHKYVPNVVRNPSSPRMKGPVLPVAEVQVHGSPRRLGSPRSPSAASQRSQAAAIRSGTAKPMSPATRTRSASAREPRLPASEQQQKAAAAVAGAAEAVGPDGFTLDADTAKYADDAAQQAVSVLLRSLPGLKRLLGQVGSETHDSYNHRGKLRSRRDVMQTLVQHTWVLLRDLHMNSMNSGGMDGRSRARRLESLQKELQGAQALFEDLCEEVDKVDMFFPVPQGAMASLASAKAPDGKGTADTKQLDEALRAVGVAQTSLAPLHKASLIAAEAQCIHADAILAQAREALQHEGAKDARPPFRVTVKPNSMGYIGSINSGAYRDTEEWLAQLRNTPEDPERPRFTVPKPDEDNMVFALHDSPSLGGSGSGHDRGVGGGPAMTPRALAKYGIVGDYGSIGNLDSNDWAGGYKVLTPEAEQMVSDMAEDCAHHSTQYASAHQGRRDTASGTGAAVSGSSEGADAHGSGKSKYQKAAAVAAAASVAAASGAAAAASSAGQVDSSTSASTLADQAKALDDFARARKSAPAVTTRSPKPKSFASTGVGADLDNNGGNSNNNNRGAAETEADAVAAALAVARVQNKEEEQLKEEAALTAAATKSAAMKAVGILTDVDYAEGAPGAADEQQQAAAADYAAQLPDVPEPMQDVQPVRPQTLVPGGHHQRTGSNSASSSGKRTGLAAALSAKTKGAATESELVVDLPMKGEGELTSRVLKHRDLREVTYEVRTLANGDTYKGPYLRGFKAGEGVYTFSNGDVYAGEFMEDAMEGYGVYVFANNGRYEGQWTAALYEGVGMETFARGSTYHGEYSKGMRAGFGICRYYNGDYYEGQWQAGLRHGRGMQQCTDDSNYVGDYNSGKRHGYGVYSFPNGDRYMGAYRGDVPHGYGVYLFSSGQKYEGQWHHGKKHGRCVYTIETGEQWAGEWRESKPKWVQSLADPEAMRGPHASAVQLSLRAAEEARGAAKDGASRADEHWRTNGPMQLGVRDVVLRADKAAAEAQAARQRALVVAASIDDGRKLAEEAGPTASSGSGSASGGAAAAASNAPGKSPSTATSKLKKEKSKRMSIRKMISGRF